MEGEPEHVALAAHLVAIGVKGTAAETYAQTLVGLGYDSPQDFDELTIEELKDDINFLPGHIKKVEKHRAGLPCAPGAAPGAAAVEGNGPGHPVPATPSAKPQQGGRVAAGLSALAGPPVAPLAAILKPLVEAPRVGFLQVRARDLRTNCAACATSPAGLRTGCTCGASCVLSLAQAIQAIEDAGIIPDVMRMAVVTLTTAKDQKQFGALKDDPLSVEGTAFLMKYSAEDTVPPLYRDMNDKCYDSDRSKIKPYGPFVVETVKHMKEVQAYPNGTVFRGVKADLREAYPEGRELTWHGFCSTTKSIRVLEQELFCGVVGKRTQFMIELTQVRLCICIG